MERRFFIYLIGPLVGLLIVVEASVYFLMEANLEKQVDADLRSKTDRISVAISSRIDLICNDLTVAMAYPELDEYFQFLASGQTEDTDRLGQTLQRNFLAIQAIKPTYRSISLFNRDDQYLIGAAEGPPISPTPPWAGGQSSRGGCQLSEVSATDATGFIRVRAPVWFEQEMVGAVQVTVRLENLVDGLIGGRPIGVDGYAYLIDANGIILAHRYPAAIGRDTAALESTRQITNGFLGTLTSLDERGIRKMRKSYLPLPIGRMGLVVAMPRYEILAPVRQMRNTVVPITALAAAIVIIIGISLVNRTLKPIHGLSEAVGRVADGELNHRIRTETVDDIAVLARNFNRLTENLEGAREKQRIAEAQREQLIQELKGINAELEQFTYTVSHDLKSPLVTILGFLNMAKQAAAKGDQKNLESDLEWIRKAAERMGRLLEGLLELSKIGRLKKAPEMISLSEVAGQASELLHGRLQESGVQLDIAPDLPVISGQPQQILQIFLNLVDNSIKFMNEQPEPRIEIGHRLDQGEAVCFVRDNGAGIEPQFQEQVFGLFKRLVSDDNGTGIGLATVHRIVDLHGGRIWVESEGAGQGSTFCFTLPVVPSS